MRAAMYLSLTAVCNLMPLPPIDFKSIKKSGQNNIPGILLQRKYYF